MLLSGQVVVFGSNGMAVFAHVGPSSRRYSRALPGSVAQIRVGGNARPHSHCRLLLVGGYADCHGNTYTIRHTDACADCYPNAYADRYTDAYADRHTDAYADRYTDV